MSEEHKQGGNTMFYQNLIRELLASGGRIGAYDPRHVEAFMRLYYGTLDSFSRSEFASKVTEAVHMIDQTGLVESEELAVSFGL